MSSGRRPPLSAARWTEIQQVLADAIECPAAERAVLLERRCAGDPALRQEVDSLLAAHDTDGFVDRFAPIVGLPAEAEAEWSGRDIAHYHVEEVIGRGGMAVVYKARDRRLGRPVALKFLSPSLSADPRAKGRFIAEARAAAALDHPNVCTIYEIGETDDGQMFIA